MSGIVLDDRRFYFDDACRGRVLLLDTGEVLANASRALLHYIDDDYVWVMRDNLKNITEYIGRGADDNSSLRAAATVLAVREFWGKYRQRRLMRWGPLDRSAIALAKMLPIFHDENLFFIVVPDMPEAAPEAIIPVRTSYRTFPLPERDFDLFILDVAAAGQDRLPQILLSLRPGGLLLAFLPAGSDFSRVLPNTTCLTDNAGNRLVSVRLTPELARLLREETAVGQLARQKRLIAYMLDEIGGSLGPLLASGENGPLDAAIAQASLAEDTILSVYEELLSDDIPWLANRFKESLIDYRLRRTDRLRARVFDEYRALRHDMKEYDDF